MSAVSGRPGKASLGHRNDASGISIIGLSMAAHPCCTRKTWKRSAAPRVDWPVYPRRLEHNTSPRGNRRWAETGRRPIRLVANLASSRRGLSVAAVGAEIRGDPAAWSRVRRQDGSDMGRDGGSVVARNVAQDGIAGCDGHPRNQAIAIPTSPRLSSRPKSGSSAVSIETGQADWV